MQVHQNLSILFYRKKKKADKNGYMPIYCRLTIDGIEDEISTGCKILYDEWDNDNKEVLSDNSNYKAFNKKMGQMKTDLERHFDLVVAKSGLATPQLVFASYKTPINGHKQRAERMETAAFSYELDELIKAVVKHLRKIELMEKKGTVAPSQLQLLEIEKKELLEQLEVILERGRKMWDDKEWAKTLIEAIDEFLCHFLELVLTNQRARPTFSKIITAKARIVVFINRRYKKEDLPLATIEQSFIEDFVKHIIKYHENSHNTVWKYVQILKEMIERAFTKGWIPTNVFALYTWSYEEPDDKTWPTMEQMLNLISFEFDAQDKELSDIRYIFIFQSFAGQSYAELYGLQPEHLIVGIDGKTWTDQRRKKTEVPETLPLLPICLEILELFKNDPRCLRKGKCLPVPTNQHYNRCLKLIGDKTRIECLNNCHQARYFFSNEILDANGVELKTIGILLGQKDPRSVGTYVKPKKRIISNNMKMVEEKLNSADTPLTIQKKPTGEKGARVISIKNVKVSDNERK